MKRKSFLTRKTPLKSYSQLKRTPLRKRNPDRVSKDKVWSDAVRRRDGWRCQFPGCTTVSDQLDAHHVRSRKQAPHLVYDVSNGVTLHRFPCHRFVHDNPDEGRKLSLIDSTRYEYRDD